MRLRAWMLMLALAGPAGQARADEPAPPVAAAKKPVRVGPTTVTVIDEQESVDDIISRVRRARQERAARATPPAAPIAAPAEQPGREKIKAKLRDARDRDKLSRKEARERAQRLRENLRERRANRLKGARAE